MSQSDTIEGEGGERGEREKGGVGKERRGNWKLICQKIYSSYF